MSFDFDVKQRPVGADTRINDNYVNCLGWKVRDTSSKKESGETDILRWNLMAEVDESRVRVQAQDDSLHRRHVGRLAAEIGGQGDRRLHELWMPARLIRSQRRRIQEAMRVRRRWLRL